MPGLKEPDERLCIPDFYGPGITATGYRSCLEKISKEPGGKSLKELEKI